MMTIGQVTLGIALSGFMAWLVFQGMDWQKVGASLQDVSVPVLVGAVLLFIVANFVRAIRWHLLFIHFPVSSKRLFIIQNEGMGLNNLVPVRVVGDPAQIAILSIREKVPPAVALATLGMERVIDLAARALMLLVGLFFVPELRPFASYLWILIALIILAIVTVKTVIWVGKRSDFIKKPPFIRSLALSVSQFGKHPGRLSASLLMSILYWMIVGAGAWFVAAGVGLAISPITATVAIMGTILFATTMPAAPSAIGTFEFAMLIILEWFGVEREAALGFALICHAAFYLPPTIIAAIFLPREGLQIASRLREGRPWKQMLNPAYPDPARSGESA